LLIIQRHLSHAVYNDEDLMEMFRTKIIAGSVPMNPIKEKGKKGRINSKPSRYAQPPIEQVEEEIYIEENENGNEGYNDENEDNSDDLEIDEAEEAEEADEDEAEETGSIEHDDTCAICDGGGDLLVCDSCPRTFHITCLDPPLSSVPTEEWQCPLCIEEDEDDVEGYPFESEINGEDIVNVVDESKLEDTKPAVAQRVQRSTLCPFAIDIYSVLQQIHPNFQFTKLSYRILSDFLIDMISIIVKDCITLKGRESTISAREIQTSFRLNLPGELAKHAVSEGTKAVTKYTMGWDENKKKISKNQKAGLVFSIPVVYELLKAFFPNPRGVSAVAPVYLAAVLEYLCAELAELSGNLARAEQVTVITPRHLQMAIKTDEEFLKLLASKFIARGVPAIEKQDFKHLLKNCVYSL